MGRNKQLTNIIDIHAHILPGIDDGASSWDEAKQMLSMAYQQGIRGIIATPHYRKRYKAALQDEFVTRLSEIAAEIDKEFQIKAGQEIFYFDELAEALNSNEALTLAGSRYVLIEFSPGAAYQMIFQGIRKLTLARYVPVLAHVERYRCLKAEGRIEELIRSGCLIQMNFESIQGYWFQSDVRWCRRQLLNQNIHLLGTDMHNSKNRKPDIRKALNWMEGHMSRKDCSRLLQENPKCIWNNKILG